MWPAGVLGQAVVKESKRKVLAVNSVECDMAGFWILSTLVIIAIVKSKDFPDWELIPQSVLITERRDFEDLSDKTKQMYNIFEESIVC